MPNCFLDIVTTFCRTSATLMSKMCQSPELYSCFSDAATCGGFLCASSADLKCIPSDKTCDTVNDCTNGEDEADNLCSNYNAQLLYLESKNIFGY